MSEQITPSSDLMPHHLQSESCDMRRLDLQTGQRRTQDTGRTIKIDHDITSITTRNTPKYKLNERSHDDHDR